MGKTRTVHKGDESYACTLDLFHCLCSWCVTRSPLCPSAAGFLDGTGILHSCLWPFSWKEYVLQISREEPGAIRTFTHFHPPGSCSVSSVSQRFIDRPLAPTAEVRVSARAQSEGKEKGKDRASAERDKAQQLLSACTHTQSVLA